MHLEGAAAARKVEYFVRSPQQMAFDESLAERVRTLLRGPHELKEKRMFGGSRSW